MLKNSIIKPFKMKACIFLCLVAAACALPNGRKYIENEFMLRLNEKLVKTSFQEQTIVADLASNYDFKVLSSPRLGKLKFLHLQGNAKFMKNISELESVLYIERNAIGSIDQTCEEQSSPQTWGLDRVDQREALPYTDPLNPDATYVYGERMGNNVAAYIVDSGVDVEHPEFGARGRIGYTVSDYSDEDVLGHGTHVAGTVGSSAYGVAKEVEIVAVKVLDDRGFGSASLFVEGADWVLSDHLERREALGEMPKSLLQASLGYSVSNAIDDSIAELVGEGIVCVVSAGNDDGDACGQSPARAPEAFAIGKIMKYSWLTYI